MHIYRCIEQAIKLELPNIINTQPVFIHEFFKVHTIGGLFQDPISKRKIMTI